MVLNKSESNDLKVGEGKVDMREWIAVAAVIAAFLTGGFALVLSSLPLGVAAVALLGAGLVVGSRGGWALAATTSQHPLTITGEPRR